MHKLKGRYFCVNARGKQLIRRCLHDTLICFDLMQIFLVVNLAIKTVVKIINNPLPFRHFLQGICKQRRFESLWLHLMAGLYGCLSLERYITVLMVILDHQEATRDFLKFT